MAPPVEAGGTSPTNPVSLCYPYKHQGTHTLTGMINRAIDRLSHTGYIYPVFLLILCLRRVPLVYTDNYN